MAIPIGGKLPLTRRAKLKPPQKGNIGKVFLLDRHSIGNKGHERKIGDEKGRARNQSRFQTKWRRMCGMPGVAERLVVSSPSVCGVWAHRML